MTTEAVLVLRDGEMFEGEAIGALDAGTVATGEVVFNTALAGYQEIVTDPSYAGQIITFTYPHIGNYGTNPDDDESRRPFCRGVVVRDLARRHSNHRAQAGLGDLLGRYGISGIGGIDTRRLTRLLRATCATWARRPARSAPTRLSCGRPRRKRCPPTASTSPRR